MNGNCNINPNFVALLQSVQVCVKTISDVGLSDAPDGALLTALAVAGENMNCSLKAVQESIFRSIAHPVPTTFIDNWDEISG